MREQRRIPRAATITMEPTLTLNSVTLYNVTQVFQDVYFAIDKNGHGRIFDDKYFLGLAKPKHDIDSTEFVVSIFGRLWPGGNFRRRTYPSQKQANNALIRYAEKALQTTIRNAAETH